jgi:hypothetical protein
VLRSHDYLLAFMIVLMTCFAVYIPLIVVDPLWTHFWCRRSSSSSDLMEVVLVRWVRRFMFDVVKPLPALAKKCVIEHERLTLTLFVERRVK